MASGRRAETADEATRATDGNAGDEAPKSRAARGAEETPLEATAPRDGLSGAAAANVALRGYRAVAEAVGERGDGRARVATSRGIGREWWREVDEMRGDAMPEDVPARGRRMNAEALGDSGARWS